MTISRHGSTKIKWPADKVTRWPIEALIPAASNARTHSEKQIAQIAESMKEWGWTTPVLVDDGGVIIAGHARVLAAGQLGFSEAPVMVARGWTDAQVRAYRLADNKLALNSDWDFDLLRGEIKELRDLGIDVELAGFGVMEVDQLFAADTDPNAEWQGMPEFGQENHMAFRSIVVHFTDQASVDRFAKLVKQELTDRTKYIWYPEQENEVVADKVYVAA
jgi:ParB-like chromosome segregation protein Spo0J